MRQIHTHTYKLSIMKEKNKKVCENDLVRSRVGEGTFYDKKRKKGTQFSRKTSANGYSGWEGSGMIGWGGEQSLEGHVKDFEFYSKYKKKSSIEF